MAIAYLGYRVDSNQVATAEKRLDRMSGAAGVATKAARGFMAAAASAFSGAALVRGISQFEESMSRVGAISRATEQQLATMRDTARELGSTTEFSASQAADGLNFLAMAGFSATESVTALSDVLDLATASGMQLGQSADIASNVISGFGLAASDAAEVANTLAAASSRANTNVSQLGQAMSTVAPVASSLDMSLQETAAAIGVLSDAGIQGARAGTAMRGVLASLAGPTDQAAEALSNYGLTIQDVNPETQSLADIMATLEEVGLSTSDAIKIFGREAASGALALVDANERVGELTGELTAAEGAAGDMADTMRDNLGGDIKGLMSALEGLVLSLGEAGLTAVLRGVVKAVTTLVRAFSDLVGLVSKVATSIGDFLGLSDAQARLQRSIDNSTLAMGDQIVEVQKLSALTSEGNKLTLESAKAFLEDAMARRDQLKVMREQKLQQEREREGWFDLQSEISRARAELEELQTVQLRAAEAGKDLPEGLTGSSESLAASYEAAQNRLAELLKEQQRLKDLIESGNYLTADQEAELERLRSEIADVETGIENAANGIVTLGDNTITATGLTDRLANSLNQSSRQASDLAVNLSAGATQARTLVANLGMVPTALGQLGENVVSQIESMRISNNAMTMEIEDGVDSRIAAIKAERNAILNRMELEGADMVAQSEAIARFDEKIETLQGLVSVNDTLSESINTTTTALGGSGGMRDELEKTGDEAETLADKLNGQVKSAVGSVADAFGDFVSRGFKDFAGFARSVLDTFKNMLSNMIAMAARNRIMLSLGFGGGGGGATSALAGGDSGGGGLLSSVLGGGGGSGGGGGMLGGIGAVAGAFGGGFGNAAGALFSGGFGTMFSSIGAQVGTAAATGTATSIAAAAGAVALPLAAVAAAISLFVPRIKELDRGIRVTADGLETSIEQFRKIEKSRLFGLIKSRSTNFRQASDAVADPIRDALGEMQGSALEAARVFGFGAGIFEDFSASFKVSLKGLSEEEKLQKVNEELAKMGDEFASIVPNFENMNDLINAANQAVAETAALGSTRFESQLLAAARRRGEITTTRGGPGFAEGQSLIRLQQLTDLEGKVEENTRQNNRLTQKMVDIFEQWEEVGIPRGPVVS